MWNVVNETFKLRNFYTVCIPKVGFVIDVQMECQQLKQVCKSDWYIAS